MKLIILLILGCSFAYAEVTPLFSQNNDSAHLMIQGLNSDAEIFYNSLNIKETEKNGVLVKSKVFFVKEFINRPPSKSFEIECNKSKFNATNISCRIGIFKTNNSFISYETKSLFLGVNDSYLAKKYSKNFLFETDNYRTIIFQSEDDLFKVFLTHNSHGEVISFTIRYN